MPYCVMHSYLVVRTRIAPAHVAVVSRPCEEGFRVRDGESHRGKGRHEAEGY